MARSALAVQDAVLPGKGQAVNDPLQDRKTQCLPCPASGNSKRLYGWPKRERFSGLTPELYQRDPRPLPSRCNDALCPGGLGSLLSWATSCFRPIQNPHRHRLNR